MSFLIGQTIGDYTILQQLGNGGSGVVYKVEQTITGRREAMKVLGGGSTHSPEQAERFFREIRLQASLAHPNIAAVHNAFLANDELVLICELLQGESLESLLALGPVPLPQGLALIQQVLGALSYAHAHGVMHRDVSPANIFVTTDKTAKLIDFGLARGAADVRLTREGSPQGSVHYMSPEQVRGLETLDVRTDIYSCGAVLYHLATGQTMFASESAFDIMKCHLEEAPKPPRSLNPEISGKLEAIILQAVAKKAEDRFQSADSFYQALKQVASEPNQPRRMPSRDVWRLSTSASCGALACLCLGFAVLADPLVINGGDNSLGKKHAVLGNSHASLATNLDTPPIAPIAPAAPTPARRTLRKPAAPAKVATPVASLIPAAPAQVATPVASPVAAEPAQGQTPSVPSSKQHPVKRLAHSIQRLNPFSRKTDPAKADTQ